MEVSTNRPTFARFENLLCAIFPARPVDVTGACDDKTLRRIERFQGRFMDDPDRRVDPHGKTLRRLNQSAPGAQPDWSGDSSKWSQEKKLKSLDPRMRAKVDKVLNALVDEGFKPKIFFAWRSVAVQQELVARGNSKVRFSFHNA